MFKHIFSKSFKKLVESNVFKQGVKDFKEGSVKMRSAKHFWVTQLITQREWDGFYKYNSAYCNLGKVGGTRDGEGRARGGKVKIGFVAANEVPINCELCTNEELMQIDDYRGAKNVYPRPLKEVERGEV